MSARSSVPLLLAILAAPAFAQDPEPPEPTTAPRDVRVFAGEQDRKAATIGYFTPPDRVQLVCIQYGVPQWKPQYEEMVQEAAGKTFRLGKDFWTTLDTSLMLTHGPRAIPAGHYYVGLLCDEQGKWSLALIRPGQAIRRQVSPANTDRYPIFRRIPLRHSEGKPVAPLQIRWRAAEDRPGTIRLEIAWGPHRLETTLAADLDGSKARAAAARRGKGKGRSRRKGKD